MQIAAIPSNMVVLTVENCDEVVLDETTDDFVEFYEPRN